MTSMSHTLTSRPVLRPALRPALLLALACSLFSASCDGELEFDEAGVVVSAEDAVSDLVVGCVSDDDDECGPGSAEPLVYDSLGSWDEGSERFSALVERSAALLPGGEDWFLVPRVALASESDTVYINLRAWAAGASRCPAALYPDEWDSADDMPYDPPSGAATTLRVEVYSAATKELLGAQTSRKSRISLDLGGMALGDDLLLRFSSPEFVAPQRASLDYRFSLTTHDFPDPGALCS